MFVDKEDSLFVFDDLEQSTLGLGKVWPFENPAGLLDKIQEARLRLEDIDLSQFPAGAWRNQQLSDKTHRIDVLDGLIELVIPHVEGSTSMGAEQFLRDNT